MEFLKDVLGEELYAQVAEKLGGNDKIRLANIADGSYIPKDKFDAERGNVKTLKAQIAEMSEKLNAMQSDTAQTDTLKAQLKQLSADIAKKDAEMKAQNLSYRVKDAVRGSKAKSADIIMKMLDMNAIKEDGETLLGLNEQLENMKTNYGYLFEDEAAKSGGVDPHTNTPVDATADVNAQINNALRAAVGR